MQEIDKKRPLPVAKDFCHDFPRRRQCSDFSLMDNGCGAIALIATLSQVYGETPTFRLLPLCSPESHVFLIAQEK
jgi:hypothetical protein